MAITKRHRILVATDGSPPAQAALATTVKFPWSPTAQARAVIGGSEWFPGSAEDRVAVATKYHAAVADAARRALSPRWPAAEVVVSNEPPVAAILAEAGRFKATIIVMGWRGHGTFRRLLAGSVSRAVAARAECPVLIVRAIGRAPRRFVVAFDGCPNAERALDFLCSLVPPRGNRVVLVNVVGPVRTPASVSRLPASVRGQIKTEVDALNDKQTQEARTRLDAAVARVSRYGWSATGEVRNGAPLERLFSAVDEHKADVLVLGACAVSGIERALLGSVANGALNNSPVPVLLVR